MTQKELLYMEDAIGHEQSIQKVLTDHLKQIKNQELKSFLQTQLEKHQEQENKLKQKMEDNQ